MYKHFSVITLLIGLCWTATAVERRHGILVGTALKVDAAAKTMVVRLADGTQHTLHLASRTAVHGAEDSAAGAKEAYHGLKDGSEVAVHYSAKGAEETAEEIDVIGKGGLKTTESAISRIDRKAKTLTVRTAGGAEETYRLTDSAARDAGKDISKGAEQSAKVTIYYTEEAGHKVAHFFKRAV